jgi:hypothetical protein
MAENKKQKDLGQCPEYCRAAGEEKRGKLGKSSKAARFN